jgi:hypothetical protein
MLNKNRPTTSALNRDLGNQCVPSTRSVVSGGPHFGELEGSTDHQLAGDLAQAVMGWRVFPNRIVKTDRAWIPRWRFKPFQELRDAFQLLDQAADSYSLTHGRSSMFLAEVRIGERLGRAEEPEIARAITTALARALGLEV